MTETMYAIKVNRDQFDYIANPHRSVLNRLQKSKYPDIEIGTKIRYICQDTQRTLVREVVLITKKHPGINPDWFETIDEFVN